MRSAPDSPAGFDTDAGGEHLEPVAEEQSRSLGRYRLKYQIGSGGMATVYLGHVVGAAGFNRPVAIKRIHPHLAKRSQFLAMFLDEARIASRINHPNVCTVFDFGDVNGSYFMAMEYLVGVPLTRLVAAVSMRPDLLSSERWRSLSARIVADAAEGLHAAHELTDEAGEPLGIVHRDVSPQNIFTTFDGAVKVVDFGIALARDRLQETNTGTLKGKFGYMAPEHASGETIDRRSDVWGLGVVLWEMLTGERLFKRRNDMETILAIRSGDVPRPSERIDGIPPALDELVLRALSLDADDRFDTARALGRELTGYVRSHGDPAGLADLAELMEPLFSEEKSEKIDVVRTVLLEAQREGEGELPTMPLPAADGRRLGDDTASLPAPTNEHSGVTLRDPVAPTPAESAPEATATEPEGSGADPFTAEPVAATGDPGKGTAAWARRVALAAGVVAVLGVALGLLVAGDGDGAPDGGLPPSEATEAAPVAPPGERAKAPQQAEEEGAVATSSGEPSAEPSEETVAGASTGAADDPAAETSDARSEEVTPRARRRAQRGEAAARDRRRAPAAQGHAHVVTVGGWGDVYVGGRRVGRTPLRVQLPAGRRVLTVRPSGDGPPQRVTADVPAGGVVPVVVRLDP